MTPKHFLSVAQVIRSNILGRPQRFAIASDMAAIFASANKRFDYDLFMEEAGCR